MRIPYAMAVFGKEEIRAVNSVLKTPQIVAGKKAEEFEAKIAGLFGKKNGIFVNSGSSANLLALEALNLPKNSEVITPVLTFGTTVAPIVKMGLVPAFIDIDMRKFTIKEKDIEKLIGPKTKALMIPSLFGNIPDLPLIRRIAKKHDLFFIEDSCDTLGATIGGKKTGTFSDISTTSFYAAHVITAAGEGGMICVNNDEWNQRIRMLSGWGRFSSLNETENIDKRVNKKFFGFEYDSKFTFTEIGYNLRTTDISAAFGLEQLKKLDKNSSIRRSNFLTIKKFLSDYDEFFSLPEQRRDVETNWLAFPITIRPGAPFTRNEIVKHLEYNDIQTRPVFTGNILKQPGFKKIKHVALKEGYPNADFIMINSFVIGCHHGLHKKHLTKLFDVFEKFLSTV
ncbi:MAG: NarL family transcriptional regulator [Candidatus Yanofskybacteria bacterium RIFCSPLOWO2_01_FULL_41_34]|uniref:NarL family transcriptional regulator n=1 Tax=Candidatus Yanofskybacteria bacterium RIFCSPHIGHO2_01_FULL_41_26 TaxID=1802661 RepID=A0A1F8EG60_9BACT|nr:MAG: NarL family transcriptional regulator [Candidatus Yanofskybacteria bacterium RIFCSPHIGHO2_01_FULL_41_26]OGN21147.1 MAG: NarL family transcriptional regulator [Candidatus Yanofskybacteria bacterium RIFCSPLOWO2_01_FULL_41_34]